MCRAPSQDSSAATARCREPDRRPPAPEPPDDARTAFMLLCAQRSGSLAMSFQAQTTRRPELPHLRKFVAHEPRPIILLRVQPSVSTTHDSQILHRCDPASAIRIDMVKLEHAPRGAAPTVDTGVRTPPGIAVIHGAHHRARDVARAHRNRSALSRRARASPRATAAGHRIGRCTRHRVRAITRAAVPGRRTGRCL